MTLGELIKGIGEIAAIMASVAAILHSVQTRHIVRQHKRNDHAAAPRHS